MITQEIIEGFMEELAALTRKWGVTVGGCGCCGSPGISSPYPKDQDMAEYHYTATIEFDGKGEAYADFLNWNKKEEGE